mmetsp:Transcript_19110/g.21860  ORF Transcript_19110/g.21860 Transcript_19110/m.21860 type:complete len:370 (+) Transcript_19110:117-1226(+)|eukprot:CAMPEP_0194147010 /NCGR_PEP_ID=MMETSP0152-20130528/22465_1 /TAXON_ID=1049557 /ORGANISM="Thalassiothrix antarctica, Strain L6-D1" /LENGTH=369 /DNA_ID=CAMNT_0038847677 /DNA_START=38 /DNA_END=1147 /DNA_ORIENTATION=-
MKRGHLTVSAGAVDLYRFAAEKNWIKLLKRVAEKPEECKYIDPASKYTPLHLIVLGRDSSNPAGRLSAVQAILSAYPDSAEAQDENDGLTPLHLACMIENDTLEKNEEDNAVVQLILEESPEAIDILSHEGYSPLDIHIISMSRLKKKDGNFRRSRKGNKSPIPNVILKSLLEEDILGGMAKPLDLLFECNKMALLQLMADEEAQASTLKLRARRQVRSNGADLASAFPPPSTIYQIFWVWEWILFLLKNDHSHKTAQLQHFKQPFTAVHSACQVKDCPIVMLILTIRAYPHQVRMQDDSNGNLPLHMVAGWETLDPSSISRKSMALSVLVSEYPHASKVRNKAGKTPLSLALETGTSWDSGVRRLTAR